MCCLTKLVVKVKLNFIHQVALVRRQRMDLSVFESICHLPIYLQAVQCPLTFEQKNAKKMIAMYRKWKKKDKNWEKNAKKLQNVSIILATN